VATTSAALEAWYPLSIASVPEYLRGVGLWQDGDLVSVSRIPSRHRVASIAFNQDASPKLFLKQFGNSIQERQLLNTEIRWILSDRVLSPSLVYLDEDWAVLVTRSAGLSCANVIDSVDLEEGPSLTLALGDALRMTHSIKTAPSPTPPVFGWMSKTPRWLDLDFAQRRLVTAIRDERGIRSATEEIGVLWSSSTTLTHGDLKLENIALRQTGFDFKPCFLDWEAAGGGLPDWDYAGIIQSLMAHSFRRGRALDFTRAQMIQALLHGAPNGLDVVSQAVAMRLVQTAVEWQRGQPSLSQLSLGIAQMAISLTTSPSALYDLLDSGLAAV